MSIVWILCVLGVAVLNQCLIQAYPDGAPEEACDSMNPSHQKADDPSHLIESQTGKPFFSIHVDKVNVDVNEDVYVTIVADEHYFEGFLIQARDVNEAGTAKKYGTFTVLSNKSQVLCNEQAVTHAVHKHFQNVTVKWTAPDMPVKNIQFKATVVKGFKTFFTNVRSDILNYSSSAISCLSSFLLMTFILCFITVPTSF
uniref:Reelin domain-containing protein n=1 Tax=Arion vulgaris TaxID=1028688 RepID=A0A0B7ASW4_9EUPU